MVAKTLEECEPVEGQQNQLVTKTRSSFPANREQEGTTYSFISSLALSIVLKHMAVQLSYLVLYQGTFRNQGKLFILSVSQFSQL